MSKNNPEILFKEHLKIYVLPKDKIIFECELKNQDVEYYSGIDGVWKYDGTKITHYAVQEKSRQIALFSIYKDNNGDLWLGTHENGAYKFNGTVFEKFTK